MLKDFDNFEIMDILSKAQKLEREGKDVIHLEIGEPDFPTPKPIVDAAKKALKDNKTFYTDSKGIIELREKLGEKYNFNPDNIIITGGSSLALFFSLASILEKGDEVLIKNPTYPCYKNFIRFLGGKVIYFKDENDLLEKITKKTKCIILNSPSNPTGEILNKEIFKISYEEIPFIVSDEIYSGLVYEGKSYSIKDFDENLEKSVLINGFSKLYSMTGWRLGYLLTSLNIIDDILKLQQNFFISAPTISQYAALKAFDKETLKYVEEMKKEFNRRRKLVLKYMKEFNWYVGNPVGAFYVFPYIGSDGKKFCEDVLQKKFVALAPGEEFGSKMNIRISYANSYNKIKEGLERIKEMIL